MTLILTALLFSSFHILTGNSRFYNNSHLARTQQAMYEHHAKDDGEKKTILKWFEMLILNLISLNGQILATM